MLRKVIKGSIVILCMLIIFFFSADNSIQSSKKSEKVILEISSLFGVKEHNKQEQMIKMFFVPVRKCAHFFIYFVLGLSIISFLREFSLPVRKLILLSIFLAFLYACSDEVHQLFVSGRSGEVRDVLLDTFGAGIGVYLYYLLFKHKIKENRYE